MAKFGLTRVHFKAVNKIRCPRFKQRGFYSCVVEKFSYNVIKVENFVITFLFVFEINLSHTKKKRFNSEGRPTKD